MIGARYLLKGVPTVLFGLWVLNLFVIWGCGAKPLALLDGGMARDGGALADGGMARDGGPQDGGPQDGGLLDGGSTCPCAPAFCDAITGACVREKVFMIPMADGVLLRTKVFLPNHVPAAGLPALLSRTPYRSAAATVHYEARARFFQTMGYVYVLQDCRGRYDSGGGFEPYLNEAADGKATTVWMAAQAWSNGAVGTIGASYDAFTALTAAIDNPLIKVVIADESPASETGPHRYGGALSSGRLSWLHVLDHGTWMNAAQLQQATNLLDLANADLTMLGRRSGYWQRLISAPNPIDPIWSERTLTPCYEHICAPVLSIYSMNTGWADPVEIWSALKARACAEQRAHQQLVLTPDSHGYHSTLLPYGTSPVTELILAYVERYLGGKQGVTLPAKQVMYRTADDSPSDYTYSDSWPPGVTDRTFYFNKSGIYGYLSESQPATGGQEMITVNPAVMDPCTAGAYPNYYYSSLAFAQGATLAGTPTVKLHVSATTPDVDVHAFLMEYTALGEWRMIAYGRRRARYRNGGDHLLTGPAEVVALDLDMYPVAYNVRPASHLVLVVQPGGCGFFENPHTGEPISAQTRYNVSTLTIYRGGARASRLIVPLSMP